MLFLTEFKDLKKITAPTDDVYKIHTMNLNAVTELLFSSTSSFVVVNARVWL